MRTSLLVRGLVLAIPGVLLLTRSGQAQETTRVSVSSSGSQGGNHSGVEGLSISADGQIVAFESGAWNLVGHDRNGTSDVFVHDRATGITERVSVDPSGRAFDRPSGSPSISTNGQIVAFYTADPNGSPADVFVHDRSTGITECVSLGSSLPYNSYPSISADGQIVAFESGDPYLYSYLPFDIFVYDRSTGITECVSLGSSLPYNSYPSISADGQIVAFESGDPYYVPYDIFVYDRSTGITELVSVDSSGKKGNDSSYGASISANGQIVAFSSRATNLVAGDTNGCFDVFVHDRSTGLTQRVSLDSSGAEGNSDSTTASISADGKIVAFTSKASNLVAGDTNRRPDAFVHDRSTGITERVSVDSSGAEGNEESGYHSSLSADGQIGAFASYASNLVPGDTNFRYDVFVHERCAVDATWTNYGAGFPGTNGVPSFTSRADPVLGTVLTLDLANSYGASTFGVLFIGFQRTQIHSSWGGDLLVVPVLVMVVSLPPSGTSIAGGIPIDHEVCGLAIDLQAIESDLGAAKGVSFTPGLELLLGH